MRIAYIYIRVALCDELTVVWHAADCSRCAVDADDRPLAGQMLECTHHWLVRDPGWSA